MDYRDVLTKFDGCFLGLKNITRFPRQNNR
jgi:hypothetical protein